MKKSTTMESYTMKKSMMQRFGIPAATIIGAIAIGYASAGGLDEMTGSGMRALDQATNCRGSNRFRPLCHGDPWG